MNDEELKQDIKACLKGIIDVQRMLVQDFIERNNHMVDQNKFNLDLFSFLRKQQDWLDTWSKTQTINLFINDTRQNKSEEKKTSKEEYVSYLQLASDRFTTKRSQKEIINQIIENIKKDGSNIGKDIK